MSIEVDKSGRKWVGTYGGMAVLNDKIINTTKKLSKSDFFGI